MELTNRSNLTLLSVHAQSATLPNLRTPLPYKNLDGQGVYTDPLKFSNAAAKSSCSILELEIF